MRSGSRRQVSRPKLAAFAFIAMSALRRRHVVRYRDVHVEGVLSGFQSDLERLLKFAT